ISTETICLKLPASAYRVVRAAPYCRDNTPCLIQKDGALRLAVASFQGLCMVLDLACMVVVYHFRRNKSVKGVLVTHCPKDAVYDQLAGPVAAGSDSSGGAVVPAEFLFLLWGIYLCYAVRTVHSAFHEPRYMAVAIYNELLISAIFHILRFSLDSRLHPDWMLMLFFAHTHLTVTVALCLLFIPKFVSKGTQARDDIATEAYEEELDMGRSGSYLNNSITSAWSEHSLDPEDIRVK
ncbi:unnamed protein product, partial [Lampetra planeri]